MQMGVACKRVVNIHFAVIPKGQASLETERTVLLPHMKHKECKFRGKEMHDVSAN